MRERTEGYFLSQDIYSREECLDVIVSGYFQIFYAFLDSVGVGDLCHGEIFGIERKQYFESND
jgi:hypothetical protein